MTDCVSSSFAVLGHKAVTYYELNSIYGHDTFLLDLSGVGTGVKVLFNSNSSIFFESIDVLMFLSLQGFLDTHMAETGRTQARKDLNQ